jgi:hypothetical protein
VRIVADRATHRLTVDDWACFFLENVAKSFPAGVYPVLLTESGRARTGTLWTPWPDAKLPLIVVPGREGIRVHAANRQDQLEGCIALGFDWIGGELGRSRHALERFKDLATFPATLEIK